MDIQKERDSDEIAKQREREAFFGAYDMVLFPWGAISLFHGRALGAGHL